MPDVPFSLRLSANPLQFSAHTLTLATEYFAP